MARIIEPFKQFFDGAGDPLVDGWLHFLQSGTNNTDKNTYSDINETVANTNPLQLDSEGRCPDVFGSGSYRVVSYTNDTVLDSPAEQIQVKDPVPGTSIVGAEFASWEATVTYSEGAIVTDNDMYYKSLSDSNTGNLTTDTSYWQQFDFIYVYNANATYTVGQTVLFTDNSLYNCGTATTAGQSPTTHPDSWEPSTRILKNIKEIVLDYGTFTGGTQDFDLALADVGLITISTAEATFTFSNVGTTAQNSKFELYITNGGSQTVNLPASSLFAGGTAPTLTAAGLDQLVFEFLGVATAPVVHTIELDLQTGA